MTRSAVGPGARAFRGIACGALSLGIVLSCGEERTPSPVATEAGVRDASKTAEPDRRILPEGGLDAAFVLDAGSETAPSRPDVRAAPDTGSRDRNEPDAGSDARAADGSSHYPADASDAPTCGQGQSCCGGRCAGELTCRLEHCSCIVSLSGKHYVTASGNVFGIGPAGPRPIVHADTLTEIEDAIEVSDSSTHACARLEDGRVQCWSTIAGGNEAGELGNGSYGDEPEPGQAHPVLVAATDGGLTPLDGVQSLDAVSSGCPHRRTTCAIRNDTTLWCWGANVEEGILNGIRAPLSARAVPILSDETTVLDGVTAVSVGMRHACALRGDEAWCWGSNETGALGQGDTEDRRFPTRVDLPGSVHQIGAGVDSTCARIDGAIYCWGSNDRGQNGIGSPSARSDGCAVFCNLTPQRVEGQSGYLEGAVELHVGYRAACALDAFARPSCWGSGAPSYAAPLRLPDVGSVLDVGWLSSCGQDGIETGVVYATLGGLVRVGREAGFGACD